ncbi:serine hydrolase domain-containing protein [Maribacter aestuarii]|uniref:serine hydrolase domain-containing protein n=1 Tax=Maribacter aestuarii TaxID=1130723 RepID=UPI00248CF548|nr:serine hydrolase [Maribacter aestuarii]
MKQLQLFFFCLFLCQLGAQEIIPDKMALRNASALDNSLLSEIDLLSVNAKVDSIITNGIKNEAFPGAQVLVAEKGNIIFHKAYGYHTYDSLQPVGLSDIYDLASVTKILGPLPALMKLVEEGKLDLDAPFSNYWTPWQRRKDKRDITLREILAHQAGLEPYILFLSKVLKKDGHLKHRFVKTSKRNRFENEAYDGLYVKNRFNRKMYRIINRSDVSEDKTYRYSGLTFLIFPALIDQLTGVPYEKYITENFFKPVGAKTLGFLPMTKGFPNKIVPTEEDTIYRNTMTQGWVHDENASLLGGISGNAGLFGSASDLAKMMQLYVQFGNFNGERLLSENVVKEFIKIQYPDNDNRRGLGFDKPLLNNDTLSLSEAYPAPEVSAKSFGHSGFTGTFVWADPENQLVYIFLSNRVYPTRANRNLYEMNIRPAVQQVFYNALTRME